MRFGSTGQIPFNASRQLHLCQRAEQAVRYSDARSSAMTSSEAVPTTSLPHHWALKELPPCWNDCDSPTVCVQTGDCRCVQADHCRLAAKILSYPSGRVSLKPIFRQNHILACSKAMARVSPRLYHSSIGTMSSFLLPEWRCSLIPASLRLMWRTGIKGRTRSRPLVIISSRRHTVSPQIVFSTVR